ncbi:hypothetical protein [Rhodococcus sp. P1Y]|uniref:hypothetical protein n=1 Tax=Rhodococcus sp. P1Y TaxID=1302308 RepID=UPI00129362C1|nr:hypothetical protein [Rhodococcus sp. P1Y]
MRSAGVVCGRRHPNELVHASEPAELAAAEQYSQNGKLICMRAECATEARTRRMCSKHYMQWRRDQGKVNSE